MIETPDIAEPEPPVVDLTFDASSVDGFEHMTSNVGAYDVYFEFQDTGDAIPVNDPVALNVVVVDQNGMLIPDAVSLNVDAAMPHHRHGVVRIPTVTRVDPGRFHVEGVLFHMPGRWELYFDVTESGRTERTQVELMLD